MKRFWIGLARVGAVDLGAACVSLGIWTLFDVGAKVNPWVAVGSFLVAVIIIAGGGVLVIGFCWDAGQRGES